MIPAEMAELGREQAFGQIAWLDLTVPDAPATRTFYEAVIGWRSQDVAMRDGDESYADSPCSVGRGARSPGFAMHAASTPISLPFG